jgi:hypothetical protein
MQPQITKIKTDEKKPVYREDAKEIRIFGCEEY